MRKWFQSLGRQTRVNCSNVAPKFGMGRAKFDSIVPGAQAGHAEARQFVAVNGEGGDQEGAQVIAEDSADSPPGSVVEQDLKADRAQFVRPEHDSRVDRPVGAGVELKLEVGERLVAQEIGPQPRSRRLLTAFQDAIADGPATALRRDLLQRGVPGRTREDPLFQRVGRHALALGKLRDREPGNRVPPGEGLAVEQRARPVNGAGSAESRHCAHRGDRDGLAEEATARA